VVVSVPIGSVAFAASRETLEYTPRTENALRTAFLALHEDIIENMLRTLQNSQESSWKRRMLTREYVRHFMRDLPEELQWLSATSVRVWDPGEETVPFSLWCLGHMSTEIAITPQQGILILQGSPRGIRQFSERRASAILVPREGFSAEDVQTWWHTNAARLRLDGLQVLMGSVEQEVHVQKMATQGIRNPMYSQSVFLWQGISLHASGSGHWKTCEPPNEPHLYVPVHRFKMLERNQEVTSLSASLFATLGSLKRKIPPIYGYRESTLAKEGVPENGTLLWDWLKSHQPWLEKVANKFCRMANRAQHPGLEEYLLTGAMFRLDPRHPLRTEIEREMRMRRYLATKNGLWHNLQKFQTETEKQESKLQIFLKERYPLHAPRTVLYLWRNNPEMATRLDEKMAEFREKHPEALSMIKELNLDL
jgi:hypothetical protein